MRRLAVVFALVAAAGCGGGEPSAKSVLEKTANKLDDVRSGSLGLDLTAATADGKEVGFSVTGRFSFEPGTPLPVLDMNHADVRGKDVTKTHVLSTGTEAFVRPQDDPAYYRLPEDALSGVGRRAALGGLRIEHWMLDPVLERGDDVDTIKAKLDAVNAMNDLAGIAASVGETRLLRRIEDKDAERLRSLTGDSTITVLTGRRDQLLRRIELTIRFAPSDPSLLPEPLRALTPVSMRMTFTLSSPNSPVKVAAPASARPYSDLPKG